MFLLDAPTPGTDQDLIYSASDLVTAVQCEYAAMRVLDEKLGRSVKPRFAADAMLTRTAELGDVHERKVLERFLGDYGPWNAAAGTGVYDVAPATAMSRAALTDKHEESIAALKAGADVVFQAAFFDGSFHGRSDFLVKQHGDGGAGYAVYDTKLARHAKVSALLQLAAYGDQLAQAGITPADTVSLVLGNGVRSDHSLPDILPVFRQLRRRFLQIMSEHRAEAGPVQWGDRRYSACGRCDYCGEQVQIHRDLLLVANMRLSRRQTLIDAGVTTIDELAAMDLPTGESPTGTLAKLHEQARMQTGAESPDGGRTIVSADGRSETVSYRVLESNTLGTLPPPCAGDIFFDFEGDPLWQDPTTGKWGLEYLFGVVENPAAPGERPPFKPFWAHSKSAERQALVDFLDYVSARRRKFPQLRIYHYANYEKAALRRLSLEHVVGEDAVDELLREGILVDLYETVRNSLRISERSYSIKKLEPLYMGEDLRAGDVTDAGASVVAYAEYCALRDSGEPGADTAAAQVLAGIADYNEYDCLSTLRLRNWLLELAAERAISPGTSAREKKEGPAPYEPSPEETALLRHVDAAVPQTAAKGEPLGAEDQAVAMVAAAVGYHRRENKTFWWSHFDRCLSPPEDWAQTRNVFLAERAEVTAPWDKEPRARKLSRRLLLTGTLAEGSDLRPGAKPFLLYGTPFPDHLQGEAGEQDLHVCARGGQEIKSLTVEDGQTVLEIREMLPDGYEPFNDLPIAITPERPLSTDAQQRALQELAGRVGAALPELPQLPALDLLARRNPQLAGRRTLPIVQAGPDGYVNAITAAVTALDRSYLAVQGPPGSGKTYVGSRVIAALVQAGWRIGVVAQSHAVVDNLLTAVIDAGLDPQRVGKKTPRDGARAGSAWQQLADAKELPAFVAQGPCVVGGTAWDFADEKRFTDGVLDLLVIDEAGQYSLANTLAVSRAAQRLLLLGDPQQLPQVTQGTHPEPVDVSALGWLSAGEHILSPEKGYFLALTWRMYPQLCAAVSALSYDGMLHSAPAAAKRALEGAGAGISTVLVDHLGNATSSPQEADEVIRQVQRHLGLSWNDAGEARALEQKDILVVAAYNAQVQLISNRLDAAGLHQVRVGTVDKFQGQQAVVVIVSMAVSSPDEAPRGMDFLLSRNRVNVAVSRGQWRAVIVRSPALTDYLPATTGGLEQLGAFIGLCERDSAMA